MNLTDFPNPNLETYNPGCASEIEKIITRCTDFKLQIFNTMESRFIISICIMTVLVLFRLLTIYRPLNFQKTEFYKTQIEMRLDFIIIILLVFNIAYIFLL